MISDDERREIATKLRKQADKLGLNMDAHEFANYTADVLDVDENMMWYGMELRLADLIEPDSTILTDHGEAALASVEGFIHQMRHSTEKEQNAYSAMLKKMSVELHPVDRNALLNLADEIDANGDKLLADSSLLVGTIGLMRCYANSIREALGETRKE